jgi:transposase
MAFREVAVSEVREVLRLTVLGRGLRETARLAGIDRKTVRRYLAAAAQAGFDPAAGVAAIDDALVGAVCAAIRPGRPDGHGDVWATLERRRERIADWLKQDLTLAKIGILLAREGNPVPYRTLHRYAVAELGFGRGAPTVRVVDGEPGQELQVDFGRMGLLPDPTVGRRRVVHALVFTAVFSRHTFAWLTFRQTLEAVIAGFEAAWAFFGGVFAVVIPDNLAAIVSRADPTDPRISEAFREYAQARGFVVDPARVRHPRDKPRVERTVPYVRGSFFRGETFTDLADAQAAAERWCTTTAGLRIHGTTRRRPAEVFAAQEAPLLLPAPEAPYAVPEYGDAKVHRDHHIAFGRALYSIPGDLIGQKVEVRADAGLVKVFWRGGLVKVHPRQRAGEWSTDPADLPPERTAYAMRDLDRLVTDARAIGPSVGLYAERLLEGPLPWTRMRRVYRLLGYARRFGAARTDTACARALEPDVIDVSLIGRMLERATEGEGRPAPQGRSRQLGLPLRFARDASAFAPVIVRDRRP